jgi:hypothetical protein
MDPKKVNLKIYQGATFRHKFYWYSDVEVSKTITAVTRSYPTVLTAASHGLPASDIPVAILGVGDWLNTPSAEFDDRIYGTKIDTNTLSVKVNGIGQAAYSGSSGRLVYNEPMELAAGWTARMHIRASIDDTDPLVTFTSTDGDIVLGDDGGIEPVLTDDATDLLDFDSAVYDLELEEDLTGETTRIAEGKVSLFRQVTHD